jgi:UDP-glucose 4-epimerase
MRILVTGGRGYLGGRIANTFLELGHEVTITSRSSDIKPTDSAFLTLANPDWSSVRDLANTCADMDLIIHAAGMNSTICELDPILAREFNGNATGRLVRAAENSGVGCLVYLSTAHVYSNPLSGFIDEDTAPSNPHPYATSHLIGEAKVLEASSLSVSGMRKHVIRLSNIYGSPNSLKADCWNLFINNIAKQVVINKSILLRSDSSKGLDFLTMTDFLSLMVGFTLEGADKELPDLINFGSGTTMSLLNVSHKVSAIASEIFGFNPDILDNSSHLLEESLQLNYSTKYEPMLNSFRNCSMDKEIRQLLIFTRDNFSQGILSEK